MRRWHCAMAALLATGCVDLGRPPELDRVDAFVLESDSAAAGEDARSPGADLAIPEMDAAPAEDAASELDGAAPDAPEPDAAPPDAPLVLNGKPCSDNGQCQSNVCQDGICCSAA